MSLDPNASGGSQQQPGGDADQDKKDAVSYESHRKLLGEKKRIAEEKEMLESKLKEIEKQQKEAREAELKQKEDWKSMLELREKELSMTKQELETAKTRELNGRKLDAFLSSIEGRVESKYWNMINIDDIKVSPVDGKIDLMSVNQAAENFRKEYPELIKTGSGPGMPANAPKGSGTLTVEDWQKLPTKEKKERMAEVFNANLNK